MRTLARAVTSILIAVVIAICLTVTWTTGLFWWVMFACAAAGLGILVGQWVKASRELDAFLASEDNPQPPYAISRCTIEGCPNVGVQLFHANHGFIWVCHQHAPAVTQWTGPAIFDQEESA